LLSILICIIGMIGMSYTTAGLTFVYKKMNAMTNAISYFILFFTGLVIPLSILPEVVQYISYVFPFYWCINVIKNFSIINIVLLFIVSVCWVLMGNMVYEYCFRKMIKAGKSNAY